VREICGSLRFFGAEPIIFGGPERFWRMRRGCGRRNIMLRPAHPDRWTGMGPYPAGQSLVNALSAGATAPDLSFVVWEGPPSAVSQAIVAGLASLPSAEWPDVGNLRPAALSDTGAHRCSCNAAVWALTEPARRLALGQRSKC